MGQFNAIALNCPILNQQSRYFALLDECIDRKLAKEFVGYEVKTFPQMGWAGVKNG
ncbi:hypothetical protein [aff. Roholtiella sp. LEGE 12411]|uniref:hypothetical protein n=1 Tax=aff. Roholtiella sp. LEGE 12411 TaxID=1828822 RepID=UPI001FC87C49|nr:hypothetical protein [aff. Roholtiella sp. LEGE 12411]